ncbi:AraC family transcriptional regulator [Legionella sainthelensi]|uniref:AraC family transcriptional regulator n=1 Tax=Legionella sainthelensi TaxID=28087 RepID=UPI000E201618|nr:AraC family transcriptional regulator [Legionella sainthelensi]VEB33996.1 AraC family transcriptional regulator [Legionella sainthelensi]
MITHRMDLRSYHTECHSHAHEFAQLVLPLVGSLELEAGSYSGVINKNSGIYIAPNEQHCFAGSPKNLFLVVDLKAQNHPDGYRSHEFMLTKTIKSLVQFAHKYLTVQEEDFFADSLINQLLIHFATNSFSAKGDQTVIKAKNWIDRYFADVIDISKVAKYCHLSVSQLQRRFKHIMGYSLAEYWRSQKLQHAKRLLLLNNCSIEAIAFSVGYENLSAFSRRFMQTFGESPSQWRAKALNSTKNAANG